VDRIRVGMPYLDDVRLYRHLDPGVWEEVRQGDKVTKAWHELRDRMFLFHAAWKDGQPMVLRVSSTSTLAISLDLMSADAVSEVVGLEQVALGVSLGLWSLLTLWSLANAALYRDALFGWFALYQISSMLMGLGLSGYSALMLPATAEYVSSLTSFMVLASTLTAVSFHRGMARELKVPKWAVRVLNSTLVVALFILVAFAFGLERQALSINALLIVGSMGIYLPSLFLVSIERHDPARRPVVWAYGLLGSFILMSMLPVLGLGSRLGYVGLYSTVLHSLLTALILGLLMMLRRARLLQDSLQRGMDAELAQREAQRIRAERDDKDRLLSMVAHELRTPLSVVRLAVESGQAALAGAADQRLMNHASTAIQDMDEVIERTLQASRIERGELIVQPSYATVEELLELVCLERPARGQRVHVQAEAGPHRIHSDPLWVKIVLANLIDNALKYSPPGSAVTVAMEDRTELGRGGVVVRVCNQPGTAGRPDPQRVFSKYYRSEGAHRTTGSGLGLFVVRGLAHRLGGRVEYCEGPLADPVCFEFWLPK
jgi:signal transduction histidine kinase